MARYECPQCGRGFGSMSDMLAHTQEVHAGDVPLDLGPEPTIGGRSMPSAEPGPVTTERASGSEFDVEPVSGNGSSTGAPAPKPDEDEESGQQQNPTLGTLIALLVIAAIIILNIIGGAGD